MIPIVNWLSSSDIGVMEIYNIVNWLPSSDIGVIKIHDIVNWLSSHVIYCQNFTGNKF